MKIWTIERSEPFIGPIFFEWCLFVDSKICLLLKSVDSSDCLKEGKLEVVKTSFSFQRVSSHTSRQIVCKNRFYY